MSKNKQWSELTKKEKKDVKLGGCLILAICLIFFYGCSSGDDKEKRAAQQAERENAIEQGEAKEELKQNKAEKARKSIEKSLKQSEKNFDALSASEQSFVTEIAHNRGTIRACLRVYKSKELKKIKRDYDRLTLRKMRGQFGSDIPFYSHYYSIIDSQEEGIYSLYEQGHITKDRFFSMCSEHFTLISSLNAAL